MKHRWAQITVNGSFPKTVRAYVSTDKVDICGLTMRRYTFQVVGLFAVRLHVWSGKETSVCAHNHGFPFVAMNLWGSGDEVLYRRVGDTLEVACRRTILPWIPRWYPRYATHRITSARRMVSVVLAGRELDGVSYYHDGKEWKYDDDHEYEELGDMELFE